MNLTEMRSIALGAAALAIMACGDKSKDAGNTVTAEGTAVPEDYRKAQQRFADSVIADVKAPTAVVMRLGKAYAIPSMRLRDTVVLLVGRSKCFEAARGVDPYLQGAATLWVNMSVIGSDVIQVLESDTKWTSQAGNLVVGCLNKAAASWKLDMSFGKPAGYIVQIQFKTDSAAAPIKK